MPTRNEISRLCDSYVRAVDAHDVVAVMEHFAPEAVQEEPAGSAPRGFDEIRQFFTASAGAPFEMVRLGPTTVVGNRAVFQAVVRVTLPGGVREFVSSDVITVDEDCRIVELLAFPDEAADPSA